MKKRCLLLILFVLLFTARVQAQYDRSMPYLNANGVWVFGNGGGLDFNMGSTVPFRSGLQYTIEGIASVASEITGKLLFYSDGLKCYDKNHFVMPNGNGLLGNTSTAQGVCIVPFVDSPGKYYLFVLNCQNYTPALSYSVVDMELNNVFNNKRGDIVAGRKNIILDASSLHESMIAVPGNNCDFWLLVHTYNTPVFKAYHITRNGVDTTPVLSNTGQQIQGPGAYYIGCMAVSSDRTMIAITTEAVSNPTFAPGVPSSGALLCKFDPATGQVSNGILVEANYDCYGVCFSPDGRKLYISVNNNVYPNLYQYDVQTYSTTAIVASQTLIKSNSLLGSLKLYNDTIYIPGGNTTNLNRINNPNALGIACNYQDSAINISMPGNFWVGVSTVAIGLPNSVPVLLRDTVHSKMDTAICFGANGLDVYASDTLGNDYIWNDGINSYKRTITIPGTYILRYHTPMCVQHMDTFIVVPLIKSFQTGSYNCQAWIMPMQGDTNRYIYTWYDANGHILQTHTNVSSDTLTSQNAGVYTVQVKYGNCDTNISVTLTPFYHAAFSTLSVCVTQSTQFENTSSGDPTKWLWYFGDGDTASLYNPTHIYTSAGTYDVMLIVSDSQAICRDTLIQSVEVRDFNLQLTATATTVNRNDIIYLQTASSETYTILSWQPQQFFTEKTAYTQSISVDTTRQYYVIGVSEYGCYDTAFIDIQVKPIVFIPSAFTPNGDGKNDYFRPLTWGKSLEIHSFRIYDRWGHEVWNAQGKSDTIVGWDGMYNNIPCELGVYYWVVKVITLEGKIELQKGEVSLIR